MVLNPKTSNTELLFEDKRRFRPQNFVHSSLFSEVYLFNDLPTQFKAVWERFDDNGKFDEFYSHLVVLMESFTASEAYNWSHSETLKNLIYPMFEILGYGSIESKNNSYLENTQLEVLDSHGNLLLARPSLLICEDESGKGYIKNADKNNRRSEINKYLKIPVVTSYYGSIFDRNSSRFEPKKDEIGKRGDVYNNLGPNNHVSEYLNLFGTSWGIFTDGSVWRLYRREASLLDTDKFFEFDFSELYNLFRTSNETDEQSEFFEVAKYFFWFFSYESLVKGSSVIPFSESVYQKSKVYMDQIEEELKERFVHAMTIACNGYFEKITKNSQALVVAAKTSESLIFNLIFIRSCESRRILPIHQDYIHISLKALIDKVRHFAINDNLNASMKIVNNSLKDVFGHVISNEGYDIYDYILKLHSLVESGDNGFGISGFVESVFLPDEKIFFKKNKIKNSEMIKLVYQLFYKSENGKNTQIPFNLITPRQLGSIYESFLEFQPKTTTQKMYYVKRSHKTKTYWQWIEEGEATADQKIGLPSVPKGGVIFSPNNEERKTTGSYYTPPYIADYITHKVIDAIVERKGITSYKEIKLIDPSMGSGHFLVGALEYLAKKVVSASGKQNLAEIKRDILDKCIYGIDMNVSAVKLTKLSLWLSTAMPGVKLEKLEDQLVCFDSLKDIKQWSSLPKHKLGTFDAVLGNPPWGGVVDESTESQESSGNSFDLFTRLSLKLINSKGMIGFLIPRNFLRKEVYTSLRKEVYEHLVQISDTGKFPGVMQEACVVFATKEKGNGEIIVENSLKKRAEDYAGEKIFSKILKRESVKAPSYLISIYQDDSYDDVLAKVFKETVPLGELLKISRGIEMGKKGELILCKKCSLYSTPPKKKNKSGKFEKECKCGAVLTLKNEIVSVVSSKKVPSSVSFLIGPDIKGDNSKPTRWLLNGLSGIDYKKQIFTKGPKIFIPMNSDKILSAYFADCDFYASKTAYVLSPKQKSIKLKVLSSFLNSVFMRFYFEYKINNGGKLTNSIPIEVLSQLPIPKAVLDFNDAPSDASSWFSGISKSEINKLESFFEKPVIGDKSKRVA